LKDVESAKALLDDPQTDRYSRDKDGRTPLYEAAIRGCDKVVVALLRKHEVDDTTPEQAGVSI
jgi:ankyrin repeat protein